MANDADIYLPSLTIDGRPGPILSVDLIALTISATGLTGEVNLGPISEDEGLYLPLLTIEAASYSVSGRTDTAEMTMPALDCSGTAGARGALEFPGLTATGTGLADALSDLAATLPALTISATGTTSLLGTLDCSLPELTMDASGFIVPVGNAALTLPFLTLYAEGSSTGRFAGYVLRYIRP
jgi:hypothetical protein